MKKAQENTSPEEREARESHRHGGRAATVLSTCLLLIVVALPAEASHGSGKLVYVDLAAGDLHTCALTSDGDVHCMGDNRQGEASDYHGGDAEEVSAGTSYTCVRKTGGNVDCFGRNDYGQAAGYDGGDAVEVSAGSYHACVRTAAGNVDCFGRNDYGQAAGYNGGDAVEVSAGGLHTCVRTADGDVECFGRNDYGQSEAYHEGDAVGLSAGFSYTCMVTETSSRAYVPGTKIGVTTESLKTERSVECYGAAYDNLDSDWDSSEGRFLQVSAGSFHKCALKSNGNIRCEGDNGEGRAWGYYEQDAVAVDAGGRHTCLLTNKGDVRCFGDNARGQAEGLSGDTDGDGVHDDVDNCLAQRNPAQDDKDGDNIGDECDPDADGDGWDDGYGEMLGIVDVNALPSQVRGGSTVP